MFERGKEQSERVLSLIKSPSDETDKIRPTPSPAAASQIDQRSLRHGSGKASTILLDGMREMEASYPVQRAPNLYPPASPIAYALHAPSRPDHLRSVF